MKNDIFLSIIIPAYNEKENFFRGCLEEVESYLKRQKYLWEVVLVDDGSTDASNELLADFCQKRKNFQYLKIPHGGKLAAVKTGIFSCSGRYVLFCDFDQSTPISESEKIWPEFDKGADLVIANRYGSGAERKNDSLPSLLRSLIFNLLVRIILGLEVKDTQCGFKAFKTAVARELFDSLKVHKIQKIKGSFMGAFDAELLFIAQKKGFHLATIPVIWNRVGSNKLTLTEPLKMLIAILKIRFFDLWGKYQSK